MLRLSAFGCAIVICLVSCSALAGRADFEDLVEDHIYRAGDSFTSGDLTFTVDSIYGNAYVSVADDAWSFGSGNVLGVWPGTLGFMLPEECTHVSFKYISLYPSCELIVNGERRSIIEFTSLDGETLGGASLSIVGDDLRGTLHLDGPVHDLSLVGYEMAIDDVYFVPEPATVSLLSAAGLTLVRRKRR